MKTFKQSFEIAIIFLGILLGHPSLMASLFSGGAFAQIPIGSNISPASPDGFGWVTRSIADLDGDGVRDIAVGAPQTGTIYPTATGAGAVYIYSGRTGSLIRTISNPNGTEQSIFGWYMVEAGDLDRDGKSDLLVSAPFSGTTSYGFDGRGSAYAISGADGHVIYRVDGDASGDDLGWCLASIGDLNGDGIPELLIGAPDNPTTGIGYVKIVDGATGALIARINDPDGPNPYPNSVFGTNEFGDAVSEAGDVNGDGVPDFMVGAPSARPNGMNNAGSVFIYSGKIDPVTHQFPLLYRFNGEHPNDLFGGCCGGVDSIGDLDGDGIGDLVVAAPAANPNGKLDAGSVYVFSGRTGTLLYRLDGENPEDFFGGNNCGCGPVTKLPDLDGDRVPELLIGAPLVSVPSSGPGKVTDVGRVYVYSGRTGTLLQKIENPDPVNFRLFGNSVDNLGDINGDGKLEIIIGAPTMTFDFPLVMIETNHVVGKIGPGKYYVFSLSTFKNADTIPPTTIATPSPAPNANGWNNTNVNVTLTSTDNTGGSGVKEIHYTINANPEIVVSGASTMINLTSEGITTIGYHAVDNAGNVELGHTLSVKIDKTPPVIASSQVPAANVAGWNNSNVTISFSVTDNLSGGVTCTANTATLSTEGVNQTASTTCTDTAGNSATASRTVSIDKTPPTILFGSATPPPNAAGWNNTNVSVPFTAADFLAGVAGTSVSSPLVLSAEGSAVTGTVTATDVAGNSATFTSPAFKIDKTPPVISSSQLPAANGAGWNNTNVAISFSATDTLSGGVICTVTSITVSTEGANQTVSTTCTDTAGNNASSNRTVNIDKTPPVISVSLSFVPNPAGGSDPAIKVSFTCSDSLSGVASCPAPILVSNGTTLLQAVNATATDIAGNSITAGCSLLNQFIATVQAASGKTISVKKANQLISAANSLKLLLKCP